MKVWIQNAETKRWDVTAKILSRVRNRTYKLQMDDGRITHRNRRWIRRCISNSMDGVKIANRKEDAQTEVQNDNMHTNRRSKRIEEKKAKSKMNF